MNVAATTMVSENQTHNSIACLACYFIILLHNCLHLIVLQMTHMILPQMVERGKGAIVNVSAGACCRPTPQMTVYAATKVIKSYK